MKKLFFPAFIMLLVFACKKETKTPIEPDSEIVALINPQSGAIIGAPITTTITASGGTASLADLDVKVTVPAGAMEIGTQIIIQQIVNVVNPLEKAIRIIGDWTKPITVEYQVPDNDPKSYNIFVAYAGGIWGGPRNPKISGDKISIRLGANTGSSGERGRKGSSKTYDLNLAKIFTVKPNPVALELGETQQFKAYAREGFVPRKSVSGQTFTNEEEWIAEIKRVSEILASIDDDNDAPSDDDDLVPLVPSLDGNDDDDDVVVPFTIMAYDYQFSNSKPGFTRSWTLSGVGAVNSSGLYTAPNDEASKGKTAKVTFKSKNDATNRSIEASGDVSINGGISKYEGSVTIIEERNVGGRGSSCIQGGILGLVKETKMTANITLTSYDSGFPPNWYLTFSSFDDPNSPNPINNMETNVEYSNSYYSDGGLDSRLFGSCGSMGLEAGNIGLIFNVQNKTYELSGGLRTEYEQCEIETFDICTGMWEKTKTNFDLDIPDNTINYTDLNKISGSFKKDNIEVIWDFVKVR